MHIGAQIVAREGWRHLLKGVVYHFLKNDTKTDRVLLVQFGYSNSNKAPAAYLISAPRIAFEDAAAGRVIVLAERQSSLPPWLFELSGQDLTQLNSKRSHAAKTHKDRIAQRLNFIQDAVANLDEIFSSAEPESAINAYARKCTPRQNESRFRLWLLTIICFGRNEW